MLENPTLFRALDIDWTLQNVLFSLSVVLFLVGGSTLFYLLRRGGSTRALNETELETLGRTPDGNPVRMHWVGARGARVEARADLETLRRAAERGDWALFSAWPGLFISVGSAFVLLVVAICTPRSKDMGIILWTGGGSGLFFVAVGLFMPFAALFTDIGKPSKATNPEP